MKMATGVSHSKIAREIEITLLGPVLLDGEAQYFASHFCADLGKRRIAVATELDQGETCPSDVLAEAVQTHLPTGVGEALATSCGDATVQSTGGEQAAEPP